MFFLTVRGQSARPGCTCVKKGHTQAWCCVTLDPEVTARRALFSQVFFLFAPEMSDFQNPPILLFYCSDSGILLLPTGWEALSEAMSKSF